MQAGNVKPKRPFREQLEDAVRLKFGGGGSDENVGSWTFYGTQLEDCQLQDGPQ